MLEAVGDAFGLLTLEALLFLCAGVMVAQVAAVIPGLGGAFTLAILLPFTLGMEPTSAIAMLVGAAVTSGTGNSVTSILFGVPGSPGGVATVFDGYPMAQQGKANRALYAALTASLVGGLLGAVVLALAIPVVRPLILAVGPAEFTILVVLAVVMMGSIGTSSKLKGLVSGLAGLGLAMIGQETSTATLRYDYGLLYLWEGIPIVPALIGMFAITEMMLLIRSGRSISEVSLEGVDLGAQRRQGLLDVFRNWKITLASSSSGTLIGLVPGLGAETAQFVAYSQAVKMYPKKEFGKGQVEGVIAADAATNAKEGGALVTTLALGLPGSATMAILLIALITFGVTPGRSMVTDQLSLTWMIIMVLVLANVVATTLVMLFARPLAKITFLGSSVIVASVIMVSFFGSYGVDRQIGDVVTAIVFGLVGYAMVRTGFSRVTLVVGLVLGPILEHNLLLSYYIYGWDFLTRPITVLLIVVTVLMPLAARLRGLLAARRADKGGT
jgi:putative tricarboxylic transport membrane protein